MSVIVIGICGRAGAGKSTLMKEILEAHPQAQHIYFAKALKAGLEAMGVPLQALYSPAHKEVPMEILQGHTGRHLMVTLGTEWGRDMVGPNFWVDLWKKQIPAEGVVVCDDVRMPNEIDAIRSFENHVLVGVERPGVVGSAHRSEHLNPSWYGIPVIMNDSTPEVLYERFRNVQGA